MSWLPVAKKEFLENVRNAWIIAMTAVFLVLVLLVFGVLSAISGSGGGGRVTIDQTIVGTRAFAGWLLPIMALMLGFGTLAGERESGSLGLLTAQPLSRHDIVLGKFLGLYGVLAAAVIVGLGGGGLLVLAKTADPAQGSGKLLVYILGTLVWSAAWLSITLLVSAFFRRRGTAIAGALLAWILLTMVVPVVVLILLAAVMAGNPAGLSASPPGWYAITEMLTPNSAFSGFIEHTIGGISGSVASRFVPTVANAQLYFVALLAWVALPYWGAYALFKSRDV